MRRERERERERESSPLSVLRRQGLNARTYLLIIRVVLRVFDHFVMESANLHAVGSLL